MSRPNNRSNAAPTNAEAEALISRLQRIADLHMQAHAAIMSAESMLDEALLACPSLDDDDEGMLQALPRAS